VDQWRQREVIAEIADQVTSDMETAGKVVEVDARRRLLAIRNPEFGRAYRRVLAMFRLTSFVRRAGSVIEALIGIPRGEKGGDYGFWIEMGSKTAAAQPWLRPALLTNLKRIREFLEQ
jgi:hypothetical protein